MILRRKVVVGNKDWRVVFQMSEDDQAATVAVIGDREPPNAT
jgi:hypothetical protein